VLAYDPAGSAAAAFDADTGKLVWERALPPRTPGTATGLNSGASPHDGHLLVYGQHTAVLDAATGEVAWAFEPSRVRKFPIELKEPPDPSSSPPSRSTGYSASPVSPYSYATRYPQMASSSYGRMPFLLSRPPPQYVMYSQPSATAWSPASVSAGGTAFASPGAVWASPQQAFQPRLAALAGNRLLLFGSYGLLLLPLDFPFGAKHVPASGIFVGLAGRTACLIAQNQVLLLIDVLDGTRREFDLKEVTGGYANAEIQAVTDGPLIYLTGPGGALCLNAHKAERIFKAAWPDTVAETATAALRQNSSSLWHGSYYGYGAFQYYLPPVAEVGEGLLLTRLGPHRVVALVERDADDE